MGALRLSILKMFRTGVRFYERYFVRCFTRSYASGLFTVGSFEKSFAESYEVS